MAAWLHPRRELNGPHAQHGCMVFSMVHVRRGGLMGRRGCKRPCAAQPHTLRRNLGRYCLHGLHGQHQMHGPRCRVPAWAGWPAWMARHKGCMARMGCMGILSRMRRMDHMGCIL
eukprot:362930-Chlamydomonas_euryale.AAC.3